MPDPISSDIMDLVELIVPIKMKKCEWSSCESIFENDHLALSHLKKVHKIKDKLICSWRDCTYTCTVTQNMYKYFLFM